MTGVEVAGLVLAVLPLCITALEHYDAELKSYRALFKYQTELSESTKELFFVHASFTKTIQNLCSDAAIADGEQFEEMIKHATAKKWLDNDSERKLVQFLSRQGFDAYKFKAGTICDNILEVASILDLDKKRLLKAEGALGFRSDPWLGVALANSNTSHTPKLSNTTSDKRVTYEVVRKRVKFILKGGVIGSLVKKIARDTEQLDRLLEKSSRPHTGTSHPAKSKSKEPFSRPLREIEDQACRLYRALSSVWTCSEHEKHCVNLRLDRRLRKDDGAAKQNNDQATFTLALTPPLIWRSLDIHIVEEPITRSNRIVGFQGDTKNPAQAVLSTLVIVDDLCRRAIASTSCLSFGLDHKDQILGDYPVLAPAPTDPTACSMVTLKELLSPLKRPEITAKQSMMLGLTLVSSFLQLQSTPWLQDRWCTEDVILLRSGTKLDVERPFISETYPIASRNAGARLDDSDRIFALGTMLLEIVTQTPIESRRTVPGATQEDPVIMRSYLRDDADGWLDCFAESIAACSKFYQCRWDLKLDNPVERMEFIEAVLYPFQRDLRW